MARIKKTKQRRPGSASAVSDTPSRNGSPQEEPDGNPTQKAGPACKLPCEASGQQQLLVKLDDTDGQPPPGCRAPTTPACGTAQAAAAIQGTALLQNVAGPHAGHAGAIAQATTVPEANGISSQDLRVVASKAGSTSPDVSEGRPAGPRAHKSRLFARYHLEPGFQAGAASPVPKLSSWGGTKRPADSDAASDAAKRGRWEAGGAPLQQGQAGWRPHGASTASSQQQNGMAQLPAREPLCAAPPSIGRNGMAQLPARESLCAAPPMIGRNGLSHDQLNLAGASVLAALKQAMKSTAGPGLMAKVLKLVRQACTQCDGSDAKQVAAAFLQTCDSQQPPLLPESLIELLREVAGWCSSAPPSLVMGLIERALQKCTEAEASSAQFSKALTELQTHGFSIPGDLLRTTHSRLERLLQSKCNCPWGLLAASLPIFGFKKGSLSMHQLWRLLSLVQKYDSSLQRPEDIAVILPYCCEFGVWPSSDVLRAVFTSLTSASATHDRLLPAVYVDVFWSFAQFWLCANEPLHNRQLCSLVAAKIKGIKQGGLSGLSAQGLLRLLQGLALLDGLTPDLWHSILFILEGKGLQGLPQHLSRSLSQVWCLVSGAEVPGFKHVSKPTQLISDPFSMASTAQTAKHVAQISRVLQSLGISHKTHFCPFPATMPCVDVLLPQSMAILVSIGLDPHIAEPNGSGLTHTPLALKQKALYGHGICSKVVRGSEWPSGLAEQTVVIQKILLQHSGAGSSRE